MSDVEVEIDDEEEIIRVYTRPDSDTWGLTKLRQTDFARIMASHSGISLWRLKFCDHQHAMSRLDTPKRKGTAICKAKQLKELGLRFFASSATAAHLSARCVGCDFAVDYKKGLCKRTDDSPCGFDIQNNQTSTSKILSNKKYFNVAVPIV